MKITIKRQDMIPTRHANRVIQPAVEIEDVVQPGETPYDASRRINLMVNAIFARTVLDQLGFTDRMVDVGTEAWCDEFLSSVSSDHPVSKINTPVPLSKELQTFIENVAKKFNDSLKDAFETK